MKVRIVREEHPNADPRESIVFAEAWEKSEITGHEAWRYISGTLRVIERNRQKDVEAAIAGCRDAVRDYVRRHNGVTEQVLCEYEEDGT